MNDYYLLLDQYIEKFQKSLPSAIEDTDVITLESLINQIYLDQVAGGCSAELENAIVNALGWVSAMVNEIQRNNDGRRGAEYFTKIKQLANILKRIRFYTK